MKKIHLEHVNLTVEDPDATAAEFERLFDWKVRWAGDSKLGGRTVHVGDDDVYLALYTLGNPERHPSDSYHTHQGFNHVGFVVEDLDAAEARVIAAGYEPHSHGDYEPGRRFYFDTREGIEVELVSYD